MAGCVTRWTETATVEDLEPGDLIGLELQRRTPRQWHLRVEPPLPGLAERCQQILPPIGDQPLTFRFHGGSYLRVTKSPSCAGLEAGPLYLEYVGDGVFRLRCDALGQEGEEQLPEPIRALSRPLRDPAGYEVALRAAELAGQGGFHKLLCLANVRELEYLEHQVRTVRTVLNRFRGRALLCDEVGLGKTIEAGLVIAELLLRRLARSVLVLTPPSLTSQWHGELRRKFSLDFTTHDEPRFRELGVEAWHRHDRIIASFHTAKREPHRGAILRRAWDILVVDEAHYLRNRNTVLWRFVSQIRKQYVLLLTATPVQNNLDELYNLVTLLEPGLLSTQRRFQSLFVDRRDRLTPRNVDRLHELLREVMVRNRRSTVGIRFTRRVAETFYVDPSPEEEAVYQDVSGFVHQKLRAADRRFNRNVLLTLQLALGSAPLSAARTLHKLADAAPASAGELRTLAERAERLGGGTKLQALLELLDRFPGKLVVFTHFRATLEAIEAAVREAGHEVALFHGGMSRKAKEEAIERFRTRARVLISTDAGSEGRNLQFAQGICNYDVPWNPMRIEQRIGRLSRIGQTQDVFVFNLVNKRTIEAAVLHLLEVKLHLFELVIGEIDMILGNVEEDREFQELVFELWQQSRDFSDFAARMQQLGDRLVEAKRAYLRQKQIDDRLFGDAFAPDP